MKGLFILENRVLKFISFFCFSLILTDLIIIIISGPAEAYEFSIYNAYPWFFWFFMIIAFICGWILILSSAIIHSEKNNWKIGLIAVLILDIILLFMPLIRGYYSYGSGDVLTHIGYMKDILNSGNIGGNSYPVDHILGIILHMTSGLSLPDITMIIPPAFSVFFIVSVYLLGKQIFNNKWQSLILIAFSSILLFGNYQMSFFPNGQSLFIIPLIIYLILKIYNTGNKNILLLCTILSALLVFFHPLVTVLIIFIFLIYSTIQYTQKKFKIMQTNKQNLNYILALLIIIFTLWSSYLLSLSRVVIPIIDSLLGNDEVRSELQKNLEIVNSVQLSPTYLVNLILSTYGQGIILGVLSFFCIFLLYWSITKKKNKPEFYQFFFIGGFLFLFLLSGIMFIFNGSFGFMRIYSVAMIFSLLLISSVFIEIFDIPNRFQLFLSSPIFKIFVICFILFATLYFSVFNLYFSPIIKKSNQQITLSDFDGMTTLFEYRDDSLKILELGVSQDRFYDSIYGQSAKRQNIIYGSVSPPDHFGYQLNVQEATINDNPIYIVMNDQGREFYQHFYPEFIDKWRYSSQDFERMERDTNYDRIYSNANLEVFLRA
jgi:hypothetical protein